MEFLKCKACGSYGMVPMDVTLFEESNEEGDAIGVRGQISSEEFSKPPEIEESGSDAEESRFYSCHVCGDNWLSIRKQATEGDARITFIHQMGVQPVLRRVAHVEPEIAPDEAAVRRWEYFLDETEVEEGEWLGRLADRRKVLKAICSN
jgi:hypothetical protein